ncbi:unnamed protein product [Blepharisma stoltei]|uniref:Protein transport protein Sec61 subunit beta n=1 Tax=Blepharisma stoltei TaxID=1481888 RepID=A0AAU9IAE1_9CILI|nr:unnamed protein product [Blepharisma stoltei]
MAKGTQSESSSGQTNSAVKAAMRKRGAVTKSKSAGRSDGSSAGELKLYTEDAPGLQIGPSTVLLLSLSYIAVVVILHIIGKLKG